MLINLSPRKVIALGLAATMGVAIPAALGSSNAQPANKAVASGSNTQDLNPGAGQPILQATFKTSKPEDLLMSVSLECSIITDVKVAGGNSPSSAEASGAIKVWLTIQGQNDPQPVIVPVSDTSAPPQDPSQQKPGTEADKITFCDRDHKVTLSDQEGDGKVDALEEYQLTKSANDFNWVRLNAGSGLHTVQVWAEFVPNDPNDDPTIITPGTTTAGSTSEGYVGNRTLVIEPTKLANNADMTSTL